MRLNACPDPDVLCGPGEVVGVVEGVDYFDHAHYTADAQANWSMLVAVADIAG